MQTQKQKAKQQIQSPVITKNTQRNFKNISPINALNQQSGDAQLQQLLEDFNKIDKKKMGSIKLTDALKLLKELTNIQITNQQILDRLVFNHDKFVTFDEFLSLKYEAEIDAGVHRDLINYRMLAFLRLLQDYRIKCEQGGMYTEAQKANQKVIQIKDKQMRRHKQKLLSQQKSKVLSVNSLQQGKLVQFNKAWNEYMEKYEDAAMDSIQKLKAKHLKQIEQQQQRVRIHFENYLKPSKKILDLKAKQKILVKQRHYLEADKVKSTVSRIQEKERASKTVQINQRIKKRKETLQKHQEASLMAHLKRIEKDRNEQMKQRQVDSQKMLIKLKNIQNDIVSKQSVEIRDTLQNLRETMCLTSGMMMRKSSRLKGIARSQEKIKNNKTIQKDTSIQKYQIPPINVNSRQTINGDPERRNSFKIRINSFHRTKMDASLYDP